MATLPVPMPPKKMRSDPGGDLTPEAQVPLDATSVVVWDVPPTVERGQRFVIKLGVTCPSECRPQGWTVDVRDHEGTRLITTSVSDDPWPGTDRLYYAEVDLTAPDAEGLFSWDARASGDDAEVPHAEGVARFSVRVVRPPRVLCDGCGRRRGTSHAGQWCQGCDAPLPSRDR